MPSPTDDVSWPVATGRLVIRPVTGPDIRAMWRYRRLPEVGHWLTSYPTDEREFVSRYDDPERRGKTLAVLLDDVVIGDLMVGIEDSWSQAEVTDAARATVATIGWALDPAFGGRGLATEAVEELLRICFDDLALRRVRADCFVENVPSWRLMERVGMRREAHTVGDALHRSGRWYDGYQYAILAEEWQARHPS